jgi:hypothetical protein
MLEMRQSTKTTPQRQPNRQGEEECPESSGHREPREHEEFGPVQDGEASSLNTNKGHTPLQKIFSSQETHKTDIN